MTQDKPDTRRYFHWDKASLLSECVKLAKTNHQLIEALESMIDVFDAHQAIGVIGKGLNINQARQALSSAKGGDDE